MDEANFNAGLHLIPPHMREALRLYFFHRVPVGGFLEAVLSNDLMQAAGRADLENSLALANYARFLYNYVPAGCFGSPEAYAAWIGE